MRQQKYINYYHLSTLILFLSFQTSVVNASKNSDPDSWFIDYPHCAGNRQSPINIKANSKLHVKPIEFHNYHNNDNFRVRRSNETLEIVFTKITPSVRINSDSYESEYELENIHFHWGLIGLEVGSEHFINNQEYPFEIHLEHTSFDNEFEVTLAILFEEGEENPVLEKIIHVLSSQKPEESVYGREKLSLSEFFPSKMSTFYRYNGSATEPPCTENVIWTVLGQHPKISKKQLRFFQNMKRCDANGCYSEAIGSDIRPLQPKHGRKIIKYEYEIEPKYSSNGSHLISSILSILSSSLVTFYFSLL